MPVPTQIVWASHDPATSRDQAYVLFKTIAEKQTATQLQEATLTFVPKFVAVGVVLLVGGNWMLSSAVTFTHELFDMLPRLLG